MSLSQAEIRRLLYEDEQGEVVGLDEVQLLDPPPADRVPALRELLRDQDLYLVFQAATVLAAWGDDEGLAKVEELIDRKVHTIEEIAPHRVDDYDNVYDELAYAVHLYGLSGKRRADRRRIFAKLLALYGPCRFESKLKYALLKSDLRELASDVRPAISRALAAGHPYLASQLLPVLAKWQPDAAEGLIQNFLVLPPQTPEPRANVAEALGYIDKPESVTALNKLTRHPDKAVAEEAQKSLAKLRPEGV